MNFLVPQMATMVNEAVENHEKVLRWDVGIDVWMKLMEMTAVHQLGSEIKFLGFPVNVCTGDSRVLELITLSKEAQQHQVLMGT